MKYYIINAIILICNFINVASLKISLKQVHSVITHNLGLYITFFEEFKRST